jgi:hypothetical protein
VYVHCSGHEHYDVDGRCGLLAKGGEAQQSNSGVRMLLASLVCSGAGELCLELIPFSPSPTTFCMTLP